MRMPKPAPRAHRLPPSLADPQRTGLTPASAFYNLQTCTTNLYATPQTPGHPRLKHCLVHVRDHNGARLRSLSIGRRGLGPESNPDVSSSQCAPPLALTPPQLERFERELQRCADEGYQWGERDCCSCIERAYALGLGQPAPRAIQRAAQQLSRSEEPPPP
ncbi:MAG: hypothetical protein AAGF11_11375 [Myxococcota bacterium]